jgi:hypothetical protein
VEHPRFEGDPSPGGVDQEPSLTIDPGGDAASVPPPDLTPEQRITRL